MKRTPQEIWSNAHSGVKPAMVRLTDPVEIESTRSGDRNGINGFEIDGVWYAYEWSVKRWRALQSSQVNGTE
jgi:hypothetical protein